jgi:hypothetical protein
MDNAPPVSGVGPGDVEWTNVLYERTRAVLEGNIDVAEAYYAEVQISMIELTAAMKTERADLFRMRIGLCACASRNAVFRQATMVTWPTGPFH